MKTLEEELDIQEIEMRTYNFNDKNDPETGELEFNTYLTYLKSIVSYAKKKDQRIGNCLSRGIDGCIKSIPKMMNRNTVEKTKAFKHIKSHTREQYTQTFFDKPNYDESYYLDDITPELDALKHLSQRLNDINNSEMAQKLRELYDSIKNMYSEVPSACPTPKIFELEDGEVAHDIRNTMKAFQDEIQYQIAKNQLLKIKKDNEAQTEIEIIDVGLYNKLATQLSAKEVELFQLKYRHECLLEENKKMEEMIESYKSQNEELLKKLRDSEIELKAVKEKMTKLTVYESDMNFQIIDLTQEVRKKKAKIAKLRKELEEAEEDVDSKRDKIDKFRNALDDLTEKFDELSKKSELNKSKLSLIEKA